METHSDPRRTSLRRILSDRCVLLRSKISAAASLPAGWGAAGSMVLLAALLIVPVLSFLSPRVAWTALLQDGYIPLDSAWRGMSGLWPHKDYYTPLGPAYALQNALAGLLCGDPARAIVWAPALVQLLLIPTALLLAARRLRPMAAFAALVWTTVPAVSPGYLDKSEFFPVHLAYYNGESWAVLSLVVLWAVFKPALPSVRADAAEAVLVGLWVAFAFLLKATTGAACAALLLLALPSRSASPRLLLAAAASAFLGALLPPAAFGLLVPYAADVLRAAASHAASATVDSLPGFDKLLLDLRSNLVPLAGIAAAAAFLGKRAALVLAAACAALLAACNQIHTSTAPGLFVLAAASAAQAVRAALHGRPRPFSLSAAHPFPCLPALPRLAVSASLLLVPFLSAASYLLVSVAAAAMHFWLASQPPGTPPAAWTLVLDAAPGSVGSKLAYVAKGPNGKGMEESMADAAGPGAGPAQARAAVMAIGGQANKEILADAVQGLRSLGLDRSRIVSLTFSNPFPALLGAPPAKGTALWWHLHRTFGDSPLPSPEEIFGDAEVVLEPKVYFDARTLDALRAAAAPAFGTELSKAGETEYWIYWARRGADRR